jgi:hypothetical protein
MPSLGKNLKRAIARHFVKWGSDIEPSNLPLATFVIRTSRWAESKYHQKGDYYIARQQASGATIVCQPGARSVK